MSKPKGGLGRGISALIPTSPIKTQPDTIEIKPEDEKKPMATNGLVDSTRKIEKEDKSEKVDGVEKLDKVEKTEKKDERKTGLSFVPITSIYPNPYQPRKHIDPLILAELSDSIKEHGLIQPPVVSHNPEFNEAALSEPYDENDETAKMRRARYILIAGERRWQASKLAGLVQIPVVIKETTPIQMLELALVENIQRADLNPLEEAAAYKQLVSEFRLTQEEVAQKVGKSRAAVTNALRLLDLPAEILNALNENLITEGHARAILQVKEKAARLRLLGDIINKDMSVRQAEEAARRLNFVISTKDALKEAEEAAKAEKQARFAEMENRELEYRLQSALESTNVDLTRSKKGGKIVIQFSSDEELETIIKKITGDFEI